MPNFWGSSVLLFLTRSSRVLLAAAMVSTMLAVIAPARASAAVTAPTGLSPSTGTAVSANPVLSWRPVTGAAKYSVQVSTDAGYTTLAFSVTTALTRATPKSNLPAGPLYWRVAAVDSAGVSSEWAETTFTRNAFAGPTPLTPADGEQLPFPEKPPVFSWSSLPGVSSYTLQVDDAPNFVSAASYTTSNTSFVLSTPQPANQLYYWRVQGVTRDRLVTSFSETRTYSTGPVDAPVPSYPPNTDVQPLDDVVLAWGPVAGAETYHVQISPNTDFTNNTIDVQGVKGTRWSPAMTIANGSYWWRVRARDASGAYGDWSEQPRTFRRAWSQRPTLVSPGSGPTVEQGPTFRWTPVKYADRYELDLGTDVNFTPGTYLKCFTNHTVFSPQMTVSQSLGSVTSGMDLDCTTSGTGQSREPSQPKVGIPYYWRVRGIDNPSGVVGVFSEIRSFTYTPFGSGTGGLRLLEPADGATVTVPTLSWSAVPNVTSYRVVITSRLARTVSDVTTLALSFTPPRKLVATDGPFTWRVYANTHDGRQYAGPDRSFSLTDAAAGGAVPDNLTATPVADSRMPSLSWDPVSGATSYQVWFSTPGSDTYYQLGYGNTASNSGSYAYPATTYVADTSNTIAMLTPGTYTWYVKALTPSGTVASSLAEYVILPMPHAEGHRVESGWDSATSSPAVSCSTGRVGEGSCTASDTPTLSWDAVPNAGFYYVYVTTDAAHTNVVRTYATVAPTLTPRESLKDSQAGETFYWYARPCIALKACGPLGDPGKDFNFDETFLKRSSAIVGISAGSSTPPPSGWPLEPCVTPARPDEPAVVVPDQVTFCWDDYLATTGRKAGVVSEQEAKTYRVQVSAASDFSTLLDSVEVDQTTYTAATKTYPEGPVYWRVQAVDGSANALTWSPTYVLRKSSPAPRPVSPASRATVNGAPSFAWSPQPYAAQYEVEIYRNALADPISTDSNYASINRVVTAKTDQSAYAATTSLAPGTYAWRLRRLDADARPGPWHEGSPAAPLVFTVRATAPTLSSPTSGAAVAAADMLFAWNATLGASMYRFESSSSSSFSTIKERVDTASLAWAPTAVYAAGTYYWRVSALDGSNAVLATSAPWSLTVGTATVTAPGMTYRSMTPARIVNTTTGLGGTAIAANSTRIVQVTGKGGVPTTGVGAVTLNVTVTNPAAAGTFTVYQEGKTKPATPLLSFSGAQTVPAMVQIGLPSTGRVVVANNSAGTAHLLVDVLGRFTTAADAAKSNEGRYTPLQPASLLNTATSTKPAAGSTTTVKVLGVGGVPTSGVSAIVLNLAASGSTAAGNAVAFAGGAIRPATANLHYAAAQAVANRAVVPVGADGTVRVYTSQAAHLAVDVTGWYTSATGPASGAYFVPAANPVRVADSRVGGPAPETPWTAGLTRDVQLTGVGGVPAATAVPAPVAVVYNLTASAGTTGGYLTSFPSGAARPAVQDVRFPKTKSVSNHTVGKLGSGGKVSVYNATGDTHVSVDVYGWYVQ